MDFSLKKPHTSVCNSPEFELPLSPIQRDRLRRDYGLLFHSTAVALLELAADPQYLGAKIGLLMVLHTWGQLMDVHTHVHVVIPGGGLSLDGERWLSCRDSFFLPVEVIAALVRGRFLAGLKRLWRAGKLKLDGKLAPLRTERTFQSWLATLYAKKWVTFAQGPPSDVRGADAVLKYLARYISGVAISDRRLVSHANGCVTFRYKNYAAGRQSETTTLSGVEFVRRYLLHVLPRGFVRMRRYGLLSNRQRQTAVARCRALLTADQPAGTTSAIAAGVPTATGTSVPAVASTPSAPHEASICPSCGRGRLMLCTIWPRPTLWDLLARQPSAFRAHAAQETGSGLVSDRRDIAEMLEPHDGHILIDRKHHDLGQAALGQFGDTPQRIEHAGSLWAVSTPP